MSGLLRSHQAGSSGWRRLVEILIIGLSVHAPLVPSGPPVPFSLLAFLSAFLDLTLSLRQCEEQQLGTSFQEQHERAVQHRAKWDCLAGCY